MKKMDSAIDFLGSFGVGVKVELTEATSLLETPTTTQQPQQQHEEQQEEKKNQLAIKVCNNKTHFGITSSQIACLLKGEEFAPLYSVK